jgi:ATP-dependent Clp endopeptidase proteolytic subunit ClpP
VTDAADKERTPPAVHEANAAKAHADAEAARAVARRESAEAALAELELEAKREKRNAELASDHHHRVYRFTSEVTANSVAAACSKLSEWSRLAPGCDMEIVFSSPGGSVIDGFVLFDHMLYLRGQGHHITTGVLGEAASMAGILVQAGEHRWMGSQAWYLIHRAAFGAGGKTYVVEDQVEFVKRIEQRIINIFVARSKLTAAKIKRNWERKDYWLSSDECLEAGLVDEVRA